MNVVLTKCLFVSHVRMFNSELDYTKNKRYIHPHFNSNDYVRMLVIIKILQTIYQLKYGTACCPTVIPLIFWSKLKKKISNFINQISVSMFQINSNDYVRMLVRIKIIQTIFQ